MISYQFKAPFVSPDISVTWLISKPIFASMMMFVLLISNMTLTSNFWQIMMLSVQRWIISPIYAKKMLLHWGHCRTWCGLDIKMLPALFFCCWCFWMALSTLPSFIDSYPSVDQAVPGGTNLASFLPGVRTDATTGSLSGFL